MSRFQPIYNHAFALNVTLKQDHEEETDPDIKAAIAEMLALNQKTIDSIIAGGVVAGQPIKQNF